MDHQGGDGARQFLISQLSAGVAEWKLREETFTNLAAEADRLDRVGDGASAEIQTLINALQTATVLARSCRLACAAMLTAAS